MVRKASSDQLPLFDVPVVQASTKRDTARTRVEPYIDADEHHVASLVPPWIRLGTSSWTFTGWSDLVYAGTPSQAALTQSGLGAYACHPLHRTVGIDRGFYAPIPASELAAYASQLPEGFLAVSKVWEEATIAVYPDHPRYGDKRRKRNPNYLDPELVKYEVLAHYLDSFRSHAGPFVFEFSPTPRSEGPTPDEFCEALDRFFGALPTTFRYAVELRSKGMLTPRYLDTLRAHGVAHVLNFWTAMPSVGEQLAMPGIFTSDFVVARIMQPPYSRYEDLRERYAPFDRIVVKQPEMRGDVLDLVRACLERQVSNLFTIIGNKAEGCAPLTLRAIAEAISVMPELSASTRLP